MRLTGLALVLLVVTAACTRTETAETTVATTIAASTVARTTAVTSPPTTEPEPSIPEELVGDWRLVSADGQPAVSYQDTRFLLEPDGFYNVNAGCTFVQGEMVVSGTEATILELLFPPQPNRCSGQDAERREMLEVQYNTVVGIVEDLRYLLVSQGLLVAADSQERQMEWERVLPGPRFFRPPGYIWYDPEGDPVPLDSNIISVWQGPDHCEWQAAAFLNLSWPLGTPPETFEDRRQYIRQGPSVIGTEYFSNPYQVDAVLPADATFTGYVAETGMELWLAPSDQDQVAYLVFDDQVEAWPRPVRVIACA